MYWVKVSAYYAVLAVIVFFLLQLWNVLSVIGQVVFLCVLAVLCLVLKGNWTKILLAEFFISDHHTRDSTVYWRHGLSYCSLLGFRVSGKRLVDFNSLLIDGVRKVFVFYNKGSCYLIFEVHCFTLSRLEERLHRVEKIVSRLGLDFSEGKFVSVSVEEEEREVPVISREDFDLNFNLGESYIIVVEKGGRVKDLEERGVSGNPIRVGLYYVRKGDRDIRCLKAYTTVSDFEASVFAKCFFENSSLVKPIGYKIGYRMVGKRIVFSDKVYFNPCYNTYACGTTQSGKSTLIALISSLVSHDYPVLVIDWNGGFRGLPGEVLLAGRDVSFNPFSELGPEKAVEVIGSAVEYAFGEERGFTPMQYYLLKQVVYDIASKGEVALEKVYEEILRRIQQTRKEDERNALAAILRRLAAVVSEAFSGTRPLRIPERGIVVVDLSLLGTELSKVLFTLVLLEWLFRAWSADRKTLFLVIDEVHRISPRDSSGYNILELIAKEKLKENIRLILAEQEFKGVSERIFNNCRNIFVFSLVRGEEAARFLGVDLDELRRLEPGECFYWCSGHVVKVKCDFIKLEKPRSLLTVQRKPLYVRVEERVRVDEDRALSVAAKHGVKFDVLKSVLVKLSKEKLVRLLEERDFDKLSALGLWDSRGSRWKRLGRAVLEYYGLLDSTEVSQVS